MSDVRLCFFVSGNLPVPAQAGAAAQSGQWVPKPSGQSLEEPSLPEPLPERPPLQKYPWDTQAVRDAHEAYMLSRSQLLQEEADPYMTGEVWVEEPGGGRVCGDWGREVGQTDVMQSASMSPYPHV